MSSEIFWVPEIYRGPFNIDMAKEFAEGDSLYPNAHHIREGIVIRSIPNRIDPELSRVQLKLVSNRYLESN